MISKSQIFRIEHDTLLKKSPYVSESREYGFKEPIKVFNFYWLFIFIFLFTQHHHSSSICLKLRRNKIETETCAGVRLSINGLFFTETEDKPRKLFFCKSSRGFKRIQAIGIRLKHRKRFASPTCWKHKWNGRSWILWSF